MRALAIASLLLLTSALTSCGTVFQLSAKSGTYDSHIYGGVRFDFEVVDLALDWRGSDGVLSTAVFGLYVILDLPLSFVADTLLLPVTIPLHIHRAEEKAEHERHREEDLEREVRRHREEDHQREGEKKRQ